MESSCGESWVAQDRQGCTARRGKRGLAAREGIAEGGAEGPKGAASALLQGRALRA